MKQFPAREIFLTSSAERRHPGLSIKTGCQLGRRKGSWVANGCRRVPSTQV